MGSEQIDDETPTAHDFRRMGQQYMDAATEAYRRGDISGGDSKMRAAKLCAAAAALGLIALTFVVPAQL